METRLVKELFALVDATLNDAQQTSIGRFYVRKRREPTDEAQRSDGPGDEEHEQLQVACLQTKHLLLTPLMASNLLAALLEDDDGGNLPPGSPPTRELLSYQ